MAEPVCFLKIWERQNGFWYHWCAVCLKIKNGHVAFGCAKSLLRGKNGQFGLKEPLL